MAIFAGIGVWRTRYTFATFTALAFALILLSGFSQQTVVTLGCGPGIFAMPPTVRLTNLGSR